VSGAVRPPAAAAAVLVREGTPGDAQAVALAARSLLSELGAGQTPMDEAVLAMLLEHPEEATVLIAEEAGGRLVGLLGAGWPLALRAGGRYGLIEELWVLPERRGAGVGSLLLAALVEYARERGVAMLEVGLPGERFERLEATRCFYAAGGFDQLGRRMRRRLA
jgi:GNAT superfamily N-acetyltransferase